MNNCESFERGVSMFEMLVAVAMVIIAIGAGAAITMSTHPNERTRAATQLFGAVDRAHSIAPSRGATLQIAPAGNGSSVSILDGFMSGNTVETVTIDVPIALQYAGALMRSARLAIRRDGSWVPVINATQQPCTGTEAIGMVAPPPAASSLPQAQPTLPAQEANNAHLGESYALTCTDLHISVAQ